MAEARRRAADRAAQLGFDEVTIGRVSIAVTEAATNLLKHAGGGEIVVGPAAGSGRPGVQVLALDRGAGITNVPASLRDGYSTSGTSGTGLGAIARAASSFDLYTQPGHGTVIAATIYPEGGQPGSIGGLSVAMKGEQECGDGWAVWSAGELTSILMCDGLGHGAAGGRGHRAGARRVPATRGAERERRRDLRAPGAAQHAWRRALPSPSWTAGRTRSASAASATSAPASCSEMARRSTWSASRGIAGHTIRRVQPFTYDWPRWRHPRHAQRRHRHALVAGLDTDWRHGAPTSLPACCSAITGAGATTPAWSWS